MKPLDLPPRAGGAGPVQNTCIESACQILSIARAVLHVLQMLSLQGLPTAAGPCTAPAGPGTAATFAGRQPRRRPVLVSNLAP